MARKRHFSLSSREKYWSRCNYCLRFCFGEISENIFDAQQHPFEYWVPRRCGYRPLHHLHRPKDTSFACVCVKSARARASRVCACVRPSVRPCMRVFVRACVCWCVCVQVQVRARLHACAHACARARARACVRSRRVWDRGACASACS